MSINIRNNVLTYEGSNYFRYRLILSTLSGKPVKIIDIRTKDNDPGLRVTNGTKIELNETGTSIYYTPGLLNGGELEHDCSLQRGIGIQTAGIPILKKFLAGDNEVTLTIHKRGVAPLGGGEVHFKCPVSRNLRTVQLENSGMVKRIRGTACSVRVSPAIANRIVESAKGVLLKFLPDVYIYTDHSKGAAGGKSPGFGVTLTAETTKDVFFSGQAFSPLMTTGSLPCVPEDLGKEAAMRLLDEIYRNGCVDSVFQSMTAAFMALGKKDVSRAIVGPLTPATMQFLRDLRDFFGVTFKVEHVREEDEVLPQVRLICLGIGYTNMNKRAL
ncbi:hypothetical protein DMN91_004949 [Ooceraea biroi]|uniref:RNA 3'-terminal phosphate cyclase-like protein n=1 Tax=Ooceraea biroi TaxID=2015173 RepID=A0A3L8DQK8_OOCBI|nr:hypothetical protein DMN91_004949 [Ooceraea biroi]